MNNIVIVRPIVGLHVHLMERKQAKMLYEAVESYLTNAAKEGAFQDDFDFHIMQDFANELEEYLQIDGTIFNNDRRSR